MERQQRTKPLAPLYNNPLKIQPFVNKKNQQRKNENLGTKAKKSEE